MDSQHDVFVSVGGTANDSQERFVSAIEDRLRAAGLIPHTVGRNEFGADAPLMTVRNLMDKCRGTVVVALERMYFEKGVDKPGGPKSSPLVDIRLSTPWNQIEGAMAYSRNHPLLVIVEKGLKAEGLLEPNNGWYVLTVDPDAPSLNTKEFNGVFSDWKDRVAHSETKAKSAYQFDDTMSVGALLGSLNPRQLWAALTVLAAIVAGAFSLGAWVHGAADGRTAAALTQQAK
jgi:hypothetical protein